MSVGVLKPLVEMLKLAPTLRGVNVVFGDNEVRAEDETLPRVIVVPVSDTYGPDPGYYRNLDPSVDMLWGVVERIDLHLTALAALPGFDTPVDHADAVEVLRQQVLQALKNQATSGLRFVPTAGSWLVDENSAARYGRSYVLSVNVDISIPDVAPREATVESITLTQSI